jgi:hypothetical protein
METLFLILTTCLSVASPQARYGGGTGEPNDPYLIYTVEQMNAIGANRNDWHKHFRLMADLDLSILRGTPFNLIGNDYNNPFRGLFDGNGHTISHLTITGKAFVGLFGRLLSGSEVKDLGLVDVNIAGSMRYVAGLVGLNEGNVSGCYSTGVVSGMWDVGGLVGMNSGVVMRSYSTSVVRGDEGVGGLVAFNNRGNISCCYSSGIVRGNTSVGGLVGTNHGDVTDSFWDTGTSGRTTSAGGTGKTTAEMRTARTFLCWVSEPPVWTIDEGKGYPRLWWENTPGEPITRLYHYGGGSGTQGDPYLISTAEQLSMIEVTPCDWDKHFRLTADLDLDPKLPGRKVFDKAVIAAQWEPPFTGIFDGGGHTISHLTIMTTNANAGLFGLLSPGSEVKDLGLVDTNICSSSAYYGNAASLVGCNGGDVSRCYSSGVVSGGGYVGGLVGSNSGGAVLDSYSTCAVSGDHCVGGLIGCNHGNTSCCYSSGVVNGNKAVGGLVGDNGYKGEVTCCYASGVVNGGDEVGGLTGSNWGSVTACCSTGAVSGEGNVGGLVGHNTSNGEVNCCYSTSEVSGDENVGGLVGNNERTIRNCYATGSVTGTLHVGGLVGSNRADVINSFWDTGSSDQTTSAGGTGKTTAEMQVSLTFLGWGGWDNEGNGAWTIDEGKNYPRLSWENVSGQVIAPTPQLLAQATNPCPADGALHKETWANLSWKPGDFAVSHEVYFGDDFESVDDGAQGTFQGKQTGTCFAVGLPGHPYGSGLVPGVTYYWRIDETDERQAYGIRRRGNVWSFKVGCDISHRPDPPDGAVAIVAPLLQWTAGDDALLHRVYFGTNPKPGPEELVSPQHRSTLYYHVPGLTPGATYYWQIDEIEADGTVHTGAVWSFVAQDVKAYYPSPADGANEACPAPTLTWLSGMGAAQHHVYLGDSAEAVGDGAAETDKGILLETTFAPGELEPLATYYWRVDEILIDGRVQTGQVWRFATYLVVDDFESYTDEEGDRIFETWIDGWDIPTNGSIVGYDWWGPEQTIVHSGRQSMPFSYDNSGPAHYSEALRQWNTPQNWAVGGVSDLSLWVRGLAGSFLEKPDGVVVMTGRVGYGEGHTEGTNDEYGFACKQLSGAGEIVARVESLSGAECWTRAGVMVRESLDDGSPYAAVTVTAACGVSFAHCPVQNGKGVQVNQTGPQVPHWVRLIRRGDTFTAQHSKDGLAWHDVADTDGKPVAVILAMPESVYIGVCVSSQSQTAPAVLSRIATAGAVVGEWQVAGSWYAPPNSPDDLYVALQDSSGRIGVNVHPDPMVVNVGAWTQWKIPLDEFSSVGVDLTSIRRLYIGVGDRDNPQPRGTGRIWIDDIQLRKRLP